MSPRSASGTTIDIWECSPHAPREVHHAERDDYTGNHQDLERTVSALPLKLVGEAESRTDFTVPVSRSGFLQDSFGRQHNNLRISVTDRCNLRCTYCMPEDVVFRDRSELLSFEEIAHFTRVAASL